MPRVLITEEGELASHFLLKIVSSGFPHTACKIHDTTYLYAKRKGIDGFSTGAESTGPKWF